MSNLYYLMIDIGCLVFPLAFSFSNKTKFYQKWGAFFKACGLTLLLFIIWDIWFTQINIWAFNDDYLLGLNIFNLPIEEWGFFICIPYACVFTYESVRYFTKKKKFKGWPIVLQWVLLAFSVVMCITHFSNYYTFSAFLVLAILLALQLFVIKGKYMGQFFISFAFLIIPLILSNGLLTGLEFWQYELINTTPETISDQIVWYNNAHNINLRLFSIPFEDFFYGMGMVLMNISLYEYFLRRN